MSSIPSERLVVVLLSLYLVFAQAAHINNTEYLNNLNEILDGIHDFNLFEHILSLDQVQFQCRGEELHNVDRIKHAAANCLLKRPTSSSCATICVFQELGLITTDEKNVNTDVNETAVGEFLTSTFSPQLATEFQEGINHCTTKFQKFYGDAEDCGKSTKVIHCLQALSAHICQMTRAELWSSRKELHLTNQTEACLEYDRCLGVRKIKKLASEGSRALIFNPIAVRVNYGTYECAHRSNCRSKQRVWCIENSRNSIEISIICKAAWNLGSDATDETDPLTSSVVERDQEVACKNFEECMNARGKDYDKQEEIGNLPKKFLGLYHCSYTTNCNEKQKELCEQHKDAPFIESFCRAEFPPTSLS